MINVKHIVYVVSSLRRTGPTQQLYNLASNISSKKVTIITLSPEPQNSLIEYFQDANINVVSLNLGRLSGIFLARKKLLDLFIKLSPDIIHTQGIRADSLLCRMKQSKPWVLTIRNVPHHDYPAKFGGFLGRLMARRHVKIMRKCTNVVACSQSVQNALAQKGISSYAIQNGVRNHKITKNIRQNLLQNYERPIFISAGSLIERKNFSETVKAFNKASSCANFKGSLIVLGAGKLDVQLKNQSGPNIYFLGEVDNVIEYFNCADCFVSSSKSEGLPNAVLEAFSCSLPAILSNIPSHCELQDEMPISCTIYKGVDLEISLADEYKSFSKKFISGSHKKSNEQLEAFQFSAEKMASKYNNFYNSKVHCE
ncbi:MAG: glycosyltransferase [Emcibacteraceae bacterium]|nr:glycosyltransferase [Emcibacteraceae bacterium]